MYIVCADMEGVFTPEIWINMAEKTGIEELRLTTRDISDYDVLMRKRLKILKANKLTIHDIQSVIQTMAPLDGAVEFIEWLRSRIQVIILSDTFVEFATPLMQKLGWPTLFCHHLTIDPNGTITNYNLRQTDSKRNAVISMQSLNFKVIAIGDSYNDITMLQKADRGILFSPPDTVKIEYPDFPVSYNYVDLKTIITDIIQNDTNE